MKISMKLSVMVRVDNVGAIFMASNINTMSCTKHMDIRYKYISEYVEEGVVETVSFNSANSDSNILTKS